MPVSRTIAALLLLATLTACGGVVEDTRPGQPVKTRQDAFKAMLRAFEPMGVMLRDGEYQAKPFAALAVRFDALSDGPWAHFGPDTDYRPSKSKAAVWQRADEFAGARERFIAASGALREAALGEQEAAVRAAYQAVYESCRDCHRAFRN